MIETDQQEDTTTFHGIGTGNVGTWGPPIYSEGQEQRDHTDANMGLSSSSSENNLQFPTLQNPSDALGILAQVAEEDNPTSSIQDRSSSQTQGRMIHPAIPRLQSTTSAPGSANLPYHLVENGSLTVSKVTELLQRYHTYYHPYFPLVPPQTFHVARLADTAREEPHLLTAILVISSKDLVEEPHLYDICAAYMKMLVSDLASGGDGGIEAVEALLLLAEWVPYTQRAAQTGKVGRGEEDKECWMHVGLALRIGYFLGLDRTSFRVVDENVDAQFSRKRLVWTACYISDRKISIRVGKAFWSRGPGPMTSLRREDYPSLMPQNPNDEDYASIFQAELELTALFSNVHDVLYSNPGSSFRSHLSGGYIKFIDDFRSAIYGWKSVWGTLTCSPQLKAMMLISYDYLRLYTNAFAFQATIRRALPSKEDASTPEMQQSPRRVFFNNVATVGDARFIYEGLDAAKSLLTTANNFVDPEKSLRFMPLRFYLYIVYSGVFLYRAHCVGVMSPEEEKAIRAMISETVSRLQRSSVGIQHLGSRYSELLKLLWKKVDRQHRSTHRSQDQMGRDPITSINHPSVASSGIAESPALSDQAGDFIGSWTNLPAVGDFAMNMHTASGTAEDGLWDGFLPLEASGAWDLGQFDAGDLNLTF
ncbi:hypothetical protein H2201_003655 [Coniosporium apollinis]|uniref:Xylanolytic transcriptional activator regulatory domain-containing protein n=2 Tax=Coniosporium TaxID=2810619 RepID=A0ABQ9NX04_9PEZI|nr:hypothetical protein H2199_002802 [Cladosporium sp. JES 115]KAJ9666221.1 hypothetical protein H2201_003655 [Coniosporium apollinis]